MIQVQKILKVQLVILKLFQVDLIIKNFLSSEV